MQHLTYNGQTTFVVKVNNTLTVELVLFITSQFTVEAQNVLHPIQHTHGQV
jgi:hypothetical protein